MAKLPWRRAESEPSLARSPGAVDSAPGAQSCSSLRRVLERILKLDKPEILEAYLNEVYLGQRGPVAVCGVGAAARHYFGRDPADLSLAESAMLAGAREVREVGPLDGPRLLPEGVVELHHPGAVVTPQPGVEIRHGQVLARRSAPAMGRGTARNRPRVVVADRPRRRPARRTARDLDALQHADAVAHTQGLERGLEVSIEIEASS